MTDDVSDEGMPAPRANPDLIGHEAAEATLRGAYEADHLHHAWLISGPKGIGKATLAFRFARYLLSIRGGDAGGGLFGGGLGDVDGAGAGAGQGLYVAPENPVFQRIVAGGHTDLLTIERSENDRGVLRSEIVVDDVRRTQKFFNLTAGEGGWRIVIVDSADEMNTNAANALLKVLEEPPSQAMLLLVSHNPGRLLPTIRSRCQKLRLAGLESAAVAAHLSRWAPEISTADAHMVSVLAEGSIGRGLELIETGGVGVFGEIFDLMDALPALDVPALHGFASKCAAKKGTDTFATAADLLRWSLARLVKQAGGDTGQDLTDREQALFARIGPAASLDRWLHVWEKVDDILASAERANLDRKQVILNAFSTVAQVVHS